MKKAQFTILIFICCFPSFTQAQIKTAFSQTKNWNVLSIVLEDMSCKLAVYGDSTIQTPNIDRLAKEGIVYDNAYACVGVCAPSRSAIITGMFPVAIGSHNMRIVTDPTKNKYNIPIYETVPPADVRCFTEYLRMAGVYCENQDKTDYQFLAPATAWDKTKKLPNHQDIEQYKDFPDKQPFYKVMNFWQTHESQLFPNSWMRTNEKIAFDSSKTTVPLYLPNTAKVRADIAHQYNNLLAIDKHVGVILDGLEKSGLLKNTLILFYSDHGDGLPRAKRTVYESGVKVPLIIRLPDGSMAGTRNKEFIYLMDIGPTMLSMYGISIPGYMHGRDMLFSQKQTHLREDLFFTADRFDSKYDMIRAVRYKNFKYIRNYQPQKPQFLDIDFRKVQGSTSELYKLDSLSKLDSIQSSVMRKSKPTEELFDIESDPHEVHNLAQKPAYQDLLKTMRVKLDSFQRITQDMGFMPEQDLAEIFWPGGKQPQTALPAYSITNQTLHIQCATRGASLGYKFKSQDTWTIYSNPKKIPGKTDSLYIMAHRIGYAPANIQAIKLGNAMYKP